MHTISIIILIVITICPFKSYGAIYGCYSGVIPGCTCTSTWLAADFRYKTSVICSNVGTAAEFKENLHKAQGFEFDDFQLIGYPNVRLPDTPFNDKTIIKRIIIMNSPNLKGFGSADDTGFFNNLGTTLETLVISNSQGIMSGEWEKIATKLNTNKTGINGFETTSTLALKNLEVISSAEFDDLATIKDLAENLVTLILRGTGITNFNFDLSTYAKLELLDLSETPGLKKFEQKTALPPKLMNIFMNGCSLDKFSIDTLTKLMTVSSVGLARDHLDCYCSNLPSKFVSDANIQRFRGAFCETPADTRGKPYGSICTQT